MRICCKKSGYFYDKVLAKNTTFLEGSETSQITEAKQKKVINISSDNKVE